MVLLSLSLRYALAYGFEGSGFSELRRPRGAAPKIKKKSGGALERLSFFFSAFYIIYVNLKDFKKKKPAAGGPIFF